MKPPTLLFMISSLVVSAALGGDLAADYAKYGELMVAHLDAAPFPAAARAGGHKYKDKFYSAAEHYSDKTVAIFIPKGFRETGRLDFVVHFHGWYNNVSNVLAHYRLIEQVAGSGRNAVLVVPQGPRNAPDSFGGKLENPGGFARFMQQVMETLGQSSALTNRNFTLGDILLSGHSGGYHVMAAILDHGGLTNRIKEVWLFDALYAGSDNFLSWAKSSRGRLLNLYTAQGGTKEATEQMMAALKGRGNPFLAVKETAAAPADLRSNRLIFLFTELKHDDVLEAHKTFQLFLETSCLESVNRAL